MNTTQSGREAEEQVARHLKNENHKIVAMNWRTRWCEIDVVSKTKQCVYFTEVKFRSSNTWGDGLSYITPKKLSQMKFAAEMWLHDNNWENESQLQAASVDDQGNIEIIEIL